MESETERLQGEKLSLLQKLVDIERHRKMGLEELSVNLRMLINLQEEGEAIDKRIKEIDTRLAKIRRKKDE